MFAEVFGSGLSNKVALYVPSTLNVTEQADDALVSGWVTKTHVFLAGLFGGATSQLALGSWITANGELVTEKVTIVYAYADSLTREHLTALKAYALDLKQALKQEAIAVDLNGILFFI